MLAKDEFSSEIFLEILTQEVTYFAINNINLNKCQIRHYIYSIIDNDCIHITCKLFRAEKKLIDIVYNLF